MKKLNILFALAIVTGFLLSNTVGAFTTDYTGSTGLTGTSCGASSCHAGTMGVDTTLLDVRVVGANNVDITKTSTGYVPGATYNVEVKLYVGNKVKAGFQVVPLTFITNNPAGTVINNVMPSLITITPDASNRQYVSHVTAGTTSTQVIAGGWAKWKFVWTAPATNVGAVAFHAIGNVTNSNNLSTGDSVRLMTATIQAPQISTGTAEVNSKDDLSIYPNPVQTFLHINTPAKDIKRVTIYNSVGAIVYTQNNFVEDISVENFLNGMYILVVDRNDNTSVSKVFVKQ